ncbi:MAG: peptidylprolyl isomerase, partial [Gemmatimonadota bacterium]
MRRWSMVVLALALAGCDNLKDMFSARPEVAAEASGQQLKVERLAKMMTSIKGVPLTHDAAEFITNMWVDHTLFAQALASGTLLTDSSVAVQVLWPEIAEIRGSRWHDTLVNHRAPMTPGMADSIYGADQVRLLQHILIRLQPNAEPPARIAARRKADAAYAKLKAGANFAQLATQLSEDPGSKQDGGYLQPAPKGKWVTAFDSAGWTLAPGGMTPVIESPFGYHIIRRPPAEEVRDRMVTYARERIGASLDSVYLDSLGVRRKLTVQGDAPALIRAGLASRAEASHSQKRLATYDGGALTVADFMRWVSALGPTWGNDLLGRPDTALTQFVRLIAQNQLLLQQADSAGILLAPAEWEGMLARYHGQIDTLRMSLDLFSADMTDPAVSASERSRVAAIKVESYWDRIAAGSLRPRPIPPQVAAVLRRPDNFKVNKAGIDRAVELAKELKLKADSVAQAPQVVPNQPAPGAAPFTPPPTTAPAGKP